MPKAVLVFAEKYYHHSSRAILITLKAWRIPESPHYPEGFKYSFYAVHKKRVLVGYDNHQPKGHHRHLNNVETKYEFKNLDELQKDFLKDVEEIIEKGAIDDS